MKEYPSIPNSSRAPRQPCYGFIKYDGSNIRALYNRKKGWNRFGKEKVFRGINEIIVFFEFFGSKSFAGQHTFGDKKDVVLFDVNPIGKGMLNPREFLNIFGHLKVAEHVYTGNLNEELIKNVRESKFDKIDFRSKYEIKQNPPEGIICKGGTGHNLWMAKIKSQAYFNKLKSNFVEDWEKYGE